MENKEIEDQNNHKIEQNNLNEDKTLDDDKQLNTEFKSDKNIVSSPEIYDMNDQFQESSKFDKFMSSPLKADSKKIINNCEEEKNVMNMDNIDLNKSLNKKNKLMFTFKENEDNKNELKKCNNIKQNNLPSDYLFMLETENNMKLFEKKYEQFKKNSIFNSSSLTKEINSKLSKYDEAVMTSCENVQTVTKSINNLKLEKNNDCLECKYIIDNLLIEKNQYLDDITKLQKLDQINQDKIERYLREIENLYEESISKDQTIKKLTFENSQFKKTVNSLVRECENKSNSVISFESKYSKVLEKCNNLEYEKYNFEKKLSNLEYKFKSLKQDYENVMKTTCLLRRENEKLLNKTEEYKIKLYNAEQDNVNLKHNISKNEKQISTMKKEIAFINYKEKHESLENRHNLNRSSESVTEYTDKKNNTNKENRLLRSASGKLGNSNNLLISSNNFYSGHGTSNQNFRHRRSNSIRNMHTENVESQFDKKLSDLLVKKANLENEKIKLPTKQKTLNQINRKILLDEELIDIENEINNCRLKIKSYKV